MVREELRGKFTKYYDNEFSAVEIVNGVKTVRVFKNPSVYLKAITTFGEGKDFFYGRVENGKFIEEEPHGYWMTDTGLTDEEFKTLFS